MTLLEKLKQDLELAEKATPGPWHVSNAGYVKDSAHLAVHIDYRKEQNEINEAFTSTSRTRWPATTRALIKAIEALNEAKAMNSAHEDAIRADHGNSNFEVWELKLNNALAEIKEHQ